MTNPSNHNSYESVYKAYVKVAGENDWHTNNLTFKTQTEAEEYAKDLHFRWTATTDWKVEKVDKTN